MNFTYEIPLQLVCYCACTVQSEDFQKNFLVNDLFSKETLGDSYHSVKNVLHVLSMYDSVTLLLQILEKKSTQPLKEVVKKGFFSKK